MIKRIIILGVGGNCIDILDSMLDINDAQGKQIYDCIGFLDDDQKKWNQTYYGVKVLGPLSSAQEYGDCFFVFGIGSVSNFWRRQEILLNTGIPFEQFETIIHPTASVSRTAKIGRGSVVLQHVTIATSAAIGKHVYVLPNSVISHDDMIGDFTTIAGGVCISGNVHIGFSCYIGTNAAIRDGVTIGDTSLVGMSSVVLKDVSENTVVTGNPAKLFRKVR